MMWKFLGAAAAFAALAACASVESAGRNAQSAAPSPLARVEPARVPPAAPPAAAPPVAAAPEAAAPPVAAPNLAVPTPAPRASAASSDEQVTVTPQTGRSQVRPPRGDPRSLIERNQDIRAWDQCVSRAQSSFESDPLRPQFDSPEDICSRSLGMSNRDAVPDSRRRP